jgi:hypothetical protein
MSVSHERAAVHVYCYCKLECGYRVPWGGTCPSGCAIRWTRACCAHCHTCVGFASFHPAEHACPNCKARFHGGVAIAEGVSVH